MSDVFGKNVRLTLFGESHGQMVGAVLEGMAPGIAVDEAFIAEQLTLRRPVGKISTSRVEADHFSIVSGVYEGRTTGTPICIIIPNENVRSGDYSDIRGLARPGHADYTSYAKYHGYEDSRGGGHNSGRLTAPIVAAGAIAVSALRARNIEIGTHIASCGGIADRCFASESGGDALRQEIRMLGAKAFAVLDDEAGERMRDRIAEAAAAGDSVGGVLETAVTGVPAGVGEPWYDSVESVLSHALFAIPAVKAVSFGDALSMTGAYGSDYNDEFALDGDSIYTLTNHNGGINGGITNGMPLRFSCVIKPTPSIGREQRTVDYLNGRETTISVSGRHDPAVIHRARVVVDSVTALVLCDLIAGRYGTDWLKAQ